MSYKLHVFTGFKRWIEVHHDKTYNELYNMCSRFPKSYIWHIEPIG